MPRKLTFTLRIGLALALLLAVVINAKAQSFLTNGLVAYYPFNGNANDESGFGDHGVVYGAQLCADRFGNTNRAYYFNGTNLSGIVTTGRNVPTNSAARTFSLWFRADPKYPAGTFFKSVIFDHGSSSVAGGRFLGSFLYQGAVNLVTLYVETVPGVWSCWINGWDYSQWHQMVWVVPTTNSQTKLYLDGVKRVFDDSSASNSALNTVSNAFWLGYGAGSHFDGSLDDVRTYNRALSEAEVVQLYVSEAPTNAGPPVIQGQPQPQSAVLGGQAVFLVTALGQQPVAYQWRWNGTNVLGATTATLFMPNVQAAADGLYSVYLTNASGSETSAAVRLTVLVPPPAGSATPTNGLVAYYPFNGNANDASGNGAHGSNYHAVLTSDRFGNPNSAYYFNATNLSGIVATVPGLPTGGAPRTFSLWYRADWLSTVPTRTGYLFGYGGSPSTSGWFGLRALSFDWITLGLWDAQWVAGAMPTRDGRWHHLAMLFANNNPTLVVDGTPRVWQSLPPPNKVVNSGSSPFQVGSYGGEFFDGAIDEMRIYDRAITMSEVEQIFGAESLPATSPPVIQTQPRSQTVVVGTTTNFTVFVAGPAPLGYQWRLNGNPIPLGTSPSLTIPVAQLSIAGAYDVVVTNLYGAVTSIVATFIVYLPATGPAVAPTNGLVAYYPFNGSASDTSGNGAHGSNYHAVLTSDRFGNANAAYYFNATNQSGIFATVPGLPIGGASRTFSLWYRADWLTANANRMGNLLGYGADPTYAGWFSLRAQAIDWLMVSLAYGQWIADRSPTTDGLWHHVAVVFTNNYPAMYVDGVLRTWTSYPAIGTTVSSGGSPLQIGSYSGQYFDGAVDEVRVYNRALTDQEVRSLYQSEAPPTAPTITQQPQSLSVAVGTDVAFGVAANGTPPLSFQWRKSGTNLVSATSPVFSITNAQVSNQGFYDVVVTNGYGAVTSSVADLLIQSPVVYDNFNDNAINLDLWRVVGTNSTGLLIIETNGRVEMTIAATTTNQAGYTDFRAYCEGNSRLRGDFDIQVDYALLTGANLGGVWVQLWAGWSDAVQRRDGGYYAQGTTVPAQDVSGKLRLLRLQGVLQSFYYSGGNWIPIRTGSALSTNDVPFVISVVSSDSIFQHQEIKVAFDNMTVNAGEMLWGRGATLRSCVAGSSLQGYAPFSTTTAFGYHWQKDGTNMPGATNRILTLVNVGLSDAGTYSSAVSNATTGIITNDVIILTVRPAVPATVLSGPLTNPANAHLYYLLNVSSWLEAEQAAVALGGHLTTIRNQAENDWMQNNLLELARPNNLWIGLFDPDPLHNSTDKVARRGEFVWINGEPVVYSNWQVNEPSNYLNLGEYCGAMFSPDFRFSDGGRFPGFWNDEYEGSGNQGRGVVEVIPPPAFISQPQSQTVASGSTAVFSASVVGALPLYFQWRKVGVDIANATNATLPLNNVQLGDAGAYKLFVSNAVGVATSQGAVLTVLEPVAIGGQPHAATVNQGGATNFTVSATGGGTLVYQWRRGGSPIAGANTSVLTITDAQAGDDANYSVVVSNVVSSLTSASVHLLVVLPPVITTQPVSRTNVAGTTASFSVVASGTSPNYQWRKGGVDVAGGTSNSLSLVNVTSTNAGVYDVVVWNPAGTNTSLPATLTVLVPAAITVSPSNQSILVSNSVTFSVTATGTAPLRYQWRKAGLPIGGATADTYSIAIVQTNDAGSYDVVVTNVVGTATSLAGVLTVLYPPGILVQPTNITAVLDGTAIFSVLANGSPSPTYRWLFNGTNLVGRTNATLKLTEVAASDAGSYKVVVENPHGIVTSSAATLTVLTPLTLAEALDAVGYLWTTGGNTPWVAQTNVTADGVDAAASGIITDYQQTWVETKFNGPGQLAFQWKVSSEFGFDRLVLAMDGLERSAVSGEVGWTPETFSVTGGSHTLRWTYAKDGSAAAGQDRAWLDQVNYAPSPGVLQPVYLLQPKVRLRDGLFQFDLLGEPGKTITVELSTNLHDWSPLATLTNQTGAARFVDPGTSANPTRFYRVRTP